MSVQYGKHLNRRLAQANQLEVSTGLTECLYALTTATRKVEELNAGKQVISITSNLSRTGCHVRTSTPFKLKTKIKITIKHKGITFHSDGEMLYAIPGAGMGVHFENSETAEEDALKEWLLRVSNEVLERVRERVSSGRQKIALILGIVALAATVAGLLKWLGVLR